MSVIRNPSSNILVTGGAGFIGSHLSDALLKRSDKVLVLDDFNDYYDPQLKRQNIEPFVNNPKYQLIEADIRQMGVFEEIFKDFKIDTVVHLAARAGVRPSLADPRLYYETNITGTLNLLEAMRQFKVGQLVFASSSSVYGNRSQGPFSETDMTDAQVSPYGATKKSGELLCHTYAHLYGIKTACLRFFTVYGPRNRPDMAAYLFTDAIYRGETLRQFGDGTTGRDYTFVEDTVAGIIGAIDNPVDFEVFNLGNSSPVMLKDFIATIEKVVGKRAKTEKLPMQAGDVALTFADITKAERMLGYKPETSLEEGMRKLFNWYLTSS